MKISNLLTIFIQFIPFRWSYSENTFPKNKVVLQLDLNSSDEQLFKTLCQFLWIQGDPLPLIFDVENEVYTKCGITLSTLKYLEAMGLIVFDTIDPERFIHESFCR
jgi:hypothetical protein